MATASSPSSHWRPPRTPTDSSRPGRRSPRPPGPGPIRRSRGGRIDDGLSVGLLALPPSFSPRLSRSMASSSSPKLRGGRQWAAPRREKEITSNQNRYTVSQAAKEEEHDMSRIPRIVIVGGGFGGLLAVQHLHKAPVQVTLVD